VRARLSHWVVGLLAVALLALVPAPAHAGDLEDFRAARSLYEAHDWTSAAAALESLVGGETPRLGIPALVIEARKYLAATYVFLGREESARAQFERLLREEPGYALDAAQFPREVVDLFEQVRVRLVEVRAAEAQRTALETENARLREENTRLQNELNQELSVEVARSQWLVQLPYGVGQFENGEEGLGAFFFVSEALLTATLVTTASLQPYYANQLTSALDLYGRDSPFIDQLATANQILEIVNWSSAGALLVLLAVGIAQANVAFHPTRTVRVPRSPPSISAGMQITPLSLQFSLHF
jgi:hypothetical protein